MYPKIKMVIKQALFSAYLLVTVGEMFLEEDEVRFSKRLSEPRQERCGALAQENFGHSRLLGVREVGVAALLRRKVGGVQPEMCIFCQSNNIPG